MQVVYRTAVGDWLLGKYGARPILTQMKRLGLLLDLPGGPQPYVVRRRGTKVHTKECICRSVHWSEPGNAEGERVDERPDLTCRWRDNSDES